MNVFGQLWHAMWDIEAYKKFVKNKMSKVFGFVLLVSVITFLMLLITIVYSFMSQTGGLGHLIDTYVPEFTISDGKFSCDRVIHEQNIDAGYYIDIDSSKNWDESSTETKAMMRNYQAVIIVDSTKMILKSSSSSETILFSQMSDYSYSKDDLKKYIPFVYVGFLIGSLIIFIYIIVGYFVSALFISIVGLIIASVKRLKIAWKQLYVIALYASAGPTIVFTIIALSPLYIGPPSLWIFVVSSIYMGIVIARFSKDPGFKAQNTGYQGSEYQNTGYQNTGYGNTGYQKPSGYSQSYIPTQGTDLTPDDGDIKPSDGWSFGEQDDGRSENHNR